MIRTDRLDIENWASRIESKGNFPYLISRLARVTTPITTKINIPSGSAAYLGGWDGILECELDSAFVPKGISLWEFGTESSVKGKADDDYAKRTADALGYDMGECTFVFVTPRLFSQKAKWIKAKKTEGKWKDVIVYDSVNLQQWLDMAGSVARWFASHTGKLPFDGILTAEQFWKEWSTGQKGTLQPSTVTSGREREMQQLGDFFSGMPGIRGVKASTKSEAIAFIIAAAMQFPHELRELFLGKTLLIDSEGSYRAAHTNSLTPLNLIPKFDDTQPLFVAVSGGHHVIVPLGADDTFNSDFITLPTIMKDGQVDGLIEMGLSREDAEKYSRESGRNIIILRRLLKFHGNTPAWVKSEDVLDILPAMLLGRWSEDSIGDREILEKFSGRTYLEYLQILHHWRDLEESPLIHIGHTWRLTSPLDLWTTLSTLLTDNHFKLLAECFLDVYKKNDTIEFEENARFISYFNKPKKYSGWAQEGLTQSLILIGQFGMGLQLSKITSPQLWVDKLVAELLHDASGKLWIDLDQKLPLLSEASPVSFFEAVQQSLSAEKKPLMEMFATVDGFLGSSSNHTGLLWALEGLAWLPEYLYDATVILLRLTALDPGGNLSNRPARSIAEVYKSWHWQTLASFDERMQILKKAVLQDKAVGWNLLIGMLPKHHDSAMPNHKMRWRLFDKDTHLNYTYPEIQKTHSFVLNSLIELFDRSETKFAQLLDESLSLNANDNEAALQFLEKVYDQVEQVDFTAWHALRKILSHHRSYPDAHWAAPEDILVRYENLYDKLAPVETLPKYKWLFDNFHIEFPDGKITDENFDEKHKKQQDRVDALRVDGLNKIISEFGFEKILKLAKSVKEPATIGEALAKSENTDSYLFLIFDLLKGDNPSIALIDRFVQINAYSKGLEWVFETYEKLKQVNFDPVLLANVFIPVQQSQELWDFINTTNETTRQEYWIKVRPWFNHLSIDEQVSGLNYLLDVKRFFTAINAVYMMKDNIPSDLIVKILQKAGSETASEKMSVREYEISTLFKRLNEKDDVSDDQITKLEWLFLPVLGSYGSGYNPKKLHQELATKPEFFNEVIKWVYMSKDENLIAEERKDIPEETLKNFAEQGYTLLSSWKKIPGVDEDGNIDVSFLNSWIDEVRTLAEISDRIEVADMQIGTILAQYSEKNKNHWPPTAIADIIERINSKSLKNNFSSATYNKRGSSSRMPYDGGAIERGHSEHFKKLGEIHKISHPNLSKIFFDMAENYLDHARREDEEAERSKLEY